MSDPHIVLGWILGVVAFVSVFFGSVTVWMVRDTSRQLSKLIIQETNKIPGKLTVHE